jgi:DNA topoisomerase-1
VSVRKRRNGAFVQIGTKEDEDKPKFAGLRPGQKMDTIALEAALDLFKLPRELGVTAEGEPVSANIGRFGPYVRYGSKFVSIRGDDPYTITLEDALQLFRLPRDLGLGEDGETISVGVGRFGPFVKHGKVYASIKPPDDPYTIELARAKQVLAEKAEAIRNRVIASWDDGAIQILRGQYGPYITDGKKNARIPKDREPSSLTRAECAELLAAAPERPARGRFGRGAKSAKPAAKSAPAAAPAKARPAASKAAARKSPPRKKAAKKKPTKKATKKAARKPAG